jgi:hypothetical protein
MQFQGSAVNLHKPFVITGRRVLPKHLLSACLSHLNAEVRPTPEPLDPGSKVHRIARLKEQPINSVIHNFRQAAEPGAYHRLAMEHRLDNNQAKTFITDAGEY